MKAILISFALILACAVTANAEFWTLNQIGEASCRVRVSGAAGSGSAIKDDGQYIYVLTNAHVVGSKTTATCEFFRYGRKTRRIAGSVIWTSRNKQTVNDFAIIKLPKSAFGKYPPRIAQLAPSDHVIHRDDYIASAGCPAARWLQLWEGHSLSTASKNRVLFTPPPLGGQSGSGVYTVINGDTYLCAILTWKVGADQGGAIHIGNFHRAYGGNVGEEPWLKVPSSWKYVARRTYLSGRSSSKTKPKVTKPAEPEAQIVPELNPDLSDEVIVPSTPITIASYYALADNGLFYLQDYDYILNRWQKAVTFPAGHAGHEILRWNIRVVWPSVLSEDQEAFLRDRCPGGRCPPRRPKPPQIIDPDPTPPNAPPSDDNPYGKVPPNFPPEGSEGPSVEELEKALADLKAERDALQAELEATNGSLTDKTNQLESLNAELEGLISSKSEDANRIQGLRDAISQLQGDILTQLDRISQLELNLTGKEKTVDGLLGERDRLTDENANTAWQRNLLGILFGGGSIGGILVWLVRFYLRRKKGLPLDLPSIHEKLDTAKDFLKGKAVDLAKDKLDDVLDPEAITDHINNRIDSLEEKIPEQFRGMIDFLQDKLEDRVEDRIESLKIDLHGKLDAILESQAQYAVEPTPVTVNVEPTPVHVNVEPAEVTPIVPPAPAPNQTVHVEQAPAVAPAPVQAPVPHSNKSEVDINIAFPQTPAPAAPEPEVCPSDSAEQVRSDETILDYVQSPSFPPATQRIKEFVDLKKSDGERIEELASYAHLYKEAVGLLKRNQLIAIKGDKAYRVNSQCRAGEALDEYVQMMFLRKVSSSTISSHILYHEAMIGFLYKQAVQRLKRGEFNVLGYKDVAEAVEKWVRRQFLQRMGFSDVCNAK